MSRLRLPEIARTGTHLFLLAGYVQQFRGWGRGLRRAVGDWYAARPVDEVAHQVVKYRQREGWSHRDLLRLAHPVTTEPARQDLFAWITRGERRAALPAVVRRFEAAQTASPDKLIALIRQGGLTWEMLPTQAVADRAVAAELVSAGMSLGALVRQLGRLTALGVLTPHGELTAQVVRQLTDAERLRRARLHPLQVLTALVTYAAGRGVRGGLTWEPVAAIVDALDRAFYAAFASVHPTGARLRLALDVSRSMQWATVAGSPLTPAQGTAAMALVTAATEQDVDVVAFSHHLVPVTISARQRLDVVMRRLDDIPMGGTDVSLPIVDATRRQIPVDAFVVYTDSETWAGELHPFQALRRYREVMADFIRAA